MSNFREASHKNWTSDNTTAHINAGSLQRIADAVETMAQNYVALQARAERYERWHREKCDELDRAHRQNAALRGVITKLKAKP